MEIESHRPGQSIRIERPYAKYMNSYRRSLVRQLVEEAETILRVTSGAAADLIGIALGRTGLSPEFVALAGELQRLLDNFGNLSDRPDYIARLATIRNVLDRALDWFDATRLTIQKMPGGNEGHVEGLASAPADGWWLLTPDGHTTAAGRRSRVTQTHAPESGGMEGEEFRALGPSDSAGRDWIRDHPARGPWALLPDLASDVDGSHPGG